MSIGHDSRILLLPPEITVAIFGHCMPLRPVWPSPREAPLLLAQICRQWREICLDTPQLWASIAFGSKRSVELLKKWLSRARNYPLTLYLHTLSEERAQMLMEVVKPYCSQWQDVRFVLPSSMDHQLSLSLPRLERLTLDGLVPKSDRMRAPIVLGDAPLLRYADIRNIKIDRPLERLTTLRLRATDVRTRIDEAQTIAALRCCPNSWS
ncbi:hypothetical protein B0H13DRAFT_2451136 [Mycena leptocephala]|nr:hypothetical protein B0H13DRAFT_2451136 [Mycena leptocephala]